MHCTLPDGQTVGAWQFLPGDWPPGNTRYCAKKGYAARIVNDSKTCEMFNRQSCAACVFPNGSAMAVTQATGFGFREKSCTSRGCRDPKDYPVTPYIIPPSGGQQQDASLPSWMILAGAFRVLVVITGRYPGTGIF